MDFSRRKLKKKEEESNIKKEQGSKKEEYKRFIEEGKRLYKHNRENHFIMLNYNELFKVLLWYGNFKSIESLKKLVEEKYEEKMRFMPEYQKKQLDDEDEDYKHRAEQSYKKRIAEDMIIDIKFDSLIEEENPESPATYEEREIYRKKYLREKARPESKRHNRR